MSQFDELSRARLVIGHLNWRGLKTTQGCLEDIENAVENLQAGFEGEAELHQAQDRLQEACPQLAQALPPQFWTDLEACKSMCQELSLGIDQGLDESKE